jgi:hypothetical protein
MYEVSLRPALRRRWPMPRPSPELNRISPTL